MCYVDVDSWYVPGTYIILQNILTKKTQIFKIANSQHFFANISGIGSWMIGLVDVKGLDMAQPTWLSGCLKEYLFIGKKAKNAYFAIKRSYFGQSDSHIDWVTSMPLASIFMLLDLKTNPCNFGEKYWELEFLKISFFCVGHFDFFCFIPIKIRHKLCHTIVWTQFAWLSWFAAKKTPPQTLLFRSKISMNRNPPR